MITLFITLAIIGWLISFGMAIQHIVTGWRNKDKEKFTEGINLFIFSVIGGFIVGWLWMGVAFDNVFEKWTDKHFE